MTTEAFGRTIQLFLVDGTPNGLRKATIHGWTGLTFVATGTTFAALTARPELDRTGIYILSGPDAEAVGGTRAYIGSANSVRERIRQSAQHDNGTSPAGQRRRLPEADLANMEQFLANLKIILPVVGLDLLKPQPRAVAQVNTPVEQRTVSDVKFEIRHKSGIYANAVEEDGEFIVLEGSRALTDQGYVMQSYAALKQNLVSTGVLVPAQDGRLTFAKPYSFSSPSAAAAVVLDRNSNGRTEWKVKGSKQTYHDWQQARAVAEGPSA